MLNLWWLLDNEYFFITHLKRSIYLVCSLYFLLLTSMRYLNGFIWSTVTGIKYRNIAYWDSSWLPKEVKLNLWDWLLLLFDANGLMIMAVFFVLVGRVWLISFVIYPLDYIMCVPWLTETDYVGWLCLWFANNCHDQHSIESDHVNMFSVWVLLLYPWSLTISL